MFWLIFLEKLLCKNSHLPGIIDIACVISERNVEWICPGACKALTWQAS